MSSVLIPPNFYQQVIVFLSDANLTKTPDSEMPDNPSIGNQETLYHKLHTCKGLCVDELINSIYPPDPKLSFFREQMGWNDAQIQNHHSDALAFFRDAFGLDFSKGFSKQESLLIPGALLRPYTYNPSAIETGTILPNNLSSSPQNSVQNGIVRSGGYLVKVNSLDLTARGIYGGSGLGNSSGIGKILPIDSVLLYGYILLNDPTSSQPLQWYHIHSLNPIQISLTRAWTIQSEIIAFGTDFWGRMEGLGAIEQKPGGNYHLISRQVATFPGRLI